MIFIAKFSCFIETFFIFNRFIVLVFGFSIILNFSRLFNTLDAIICYFEIKSGLLIDTQTVE